MTACTSLGRDPASGQGEFKASFPEAAASLELAEWIQSLPPASLLDAVYGDFGPSEGPLSAEPECLVGRLSAMVRFDGCAGAPPFLFEIAARSRHYGVAYLAPRFLCEGLRLGRQRQGSSLPAPEVYEDRFEVLGGAPGETTKFGFRCADIDKALWSRRDAQNVQVEPTSFSEDQPCPLLEMTLRPQRQKADGTSEAVGDVVRSVYFAP